VAALRPLSPRAAAVLMLVGALTMRGGSPGAGCWLPLRHYV